MSGGGSVTKAVEDMREKLLGLGFPKALIDDYVDVTLTGMWDHIGPGGVPDDLLDRTFQALRLSLEKSTQEYDKSSENNYMPDVITSSQSDGCHKCGHVEQDWDYQSVFGCPNCG